MALNGEEWEVGAVPVATAGVHAAVIAKNIDGYEESARVSNFCLATSHLNIMQFNAKTTNLETPQLGVVASVFDETGAVRKLHDIVCNGTGAGQKFSTRSSALRGGRCTSTCM